MFEIPDALREMVRAAGERAEVRTAIEAIYADLGRAIDERKPPCDLSGRCCNFEKWGHSLFLTTMELATFLHRLPSIARQAASADAWDGTGCPFQIGKLCGVHAVRPFGCRIFFCDPASTDWQQSLYAEMHDRIRRLHDALEVPYHYFEWRQALVAVGVPAASRGVVARNGMLLTEASEEW